METEQHIASPNPAQAAYWKGLRPTMSGTVAFDRPLAKTSLADAAYERLLEAILSGRLRGGTELSEVALAAELAVSRTPVHEALRRLSADGLVHLATSGPARVAEFTRQEIVEIYEMRICLEQAAARQAATRLTDEQVSALREGADELSDPAGRSWTAKALAFDVVFHDAIAEACGNQRLRREIRKYRHLVRAFCRMSGNSENLRDAYREHLTILAALAARNADAAGRAMALHIEARLAAVLREIPEPTSGE
jgi:GntR family transcriptional regulator, rspAB operon transcriptional repressor